MNSPEDLPGDSQPMGHELDKEILTKVEATLAEKPRGLLTDIDGTISPIAPTPEEARVSPIAREHLKTLATRLDLVAAISGRPIKAAQEMIGLPELTYVGLHGMQILREGQVHILPEARAYVPAIAEAFREVKAKIDIPGVLFEDKEVALTVHFRKTTNPVEAEGIIDAITQETAAKYGLGMRPGRMVRELVPPIDLHKGTTIRRLVDEYGLKGAIYMGDDRTDADAFVALQNLREGGGYSTLAIGVVEEETPAIVREKADVIVPGVPGVEQLLGHIVDYTQEE